MFFEPGQFPDTIGVLGGLIFNLGFTELPGGDNNTATHALNDHTYCCELSADICDGGEPPLNKAEECYDWHHRKLETRNEDAKNYGVPLIITEFGACLGSDACIQEIKSTTEVCDEFLNGWAYWQYKNYADLTTSAGTGSEGFYYSDGSL